VEAWIEVCRPHPLVVPPSSHAASSGVCEEHALLNSLRAGVLAFREDGVVVRANPGAARILRREPIELIGHSVADVIAPIEALRTAEDEPETGRPEIEVLRGDGSRGTIGFFLASYDTADDRERFVLQFQDIGSHVELRRQRDRLLAMAALGDALPSVLHELRNPLAAVLSRLELLVEESEGELQSDLHAVLSELRRMTLGLDGVGGLVRPARSSAFAAVDLAVADACRVLQPMAERAGVELESRGRALPLLPIDRGVISGVVFNLVRNAIDASRDGGRIVVSAELDSNDSSFLLRVEDDGEGMTPDVLRRSKELFFTSKDNGSGIGLALCNRVAESSGGYLEIQSEPGKGTTVALRIPVSLRHTPHEESPHESSR
jgi:signal transduction histidine kinase